MNQFALSTRDLELVVTEKTLGCLVTNAKDIKSRVEKALINYDISNYDENNIDAAKKDKALLNASAKAINDERISLEKEFMRPFEEFKAVVGETTALIKQASSKIDEVVKQEEVKTKKAKRVSIEELWDGKDFPLIKLEKIWQDRWLNKSVKTASISDDMDIAIINAKNDILTIETMDEDAELLKSLYLDTLDLGKTIRHGKMLEENRERAKKEAEQRAEAERVRAEMSKRWAEEAKKKENAPPEFRPAEKVGNYTQVMPSKQPEEAFIIKEPTLLTRIIEVTATKEDIIKLADFMNENSIKFRKVER